MKKGLTVLFSLVLILCIYGFFPNNPDKLDEKVKHLVYNVIDNYEKMNSISYNVSIRLKRLFEKDTITRKGFCQLIKSSADTLLKGYIYAKVDEGSEKYYNTENLFNIFHNKKQITIYNSEWGYKNLKSGDSRLMLDSYFLDNSLLLKWINDASNSFSAEDEVINGKSYSRLTIKQPNSENNTDRIFCFWLNKKDLTIDKITDYCKTLGDDQYNEICMYDIKFNSVNKSSLDRYIDSLLSIYKSTNFEGGSAKKKNLLKPGEKAPEFFGSTFDNEINIDYKNKKIYILDFWYMACYPCIMAIPHLVGLYREYKDLGLEILGVNPIDDKTKKKDILNRFIADKKITYPVVFINRKIADSLFQVSGYPTLFVINNKKEILYSITGFGTDAIDTIKSIVETELKK